MPLLRRGWTPPANLNIDVNSISIDFHRLCATGYNSTEGDKRE
jgi:hypothetical protein